jgi:hypothetical protein
MQGYAWSREFFTRVPAGETGKIESDHKIIEDLNDIVQG